MLSLGYHEVDGIMIIFCEKMIDRLSVVFAVILYLEKSTNSDSEDFSLIITK